MNAKHLSKFSISKKFSLFGAIIAIAIVAAFSICATNQARADEPEKNDYAENSQFFSSVESIAFINHESAGFKTKEFVNGETVKQIYESIQGEGT